MVSNNPQILLLMCNNCQGMTGKLLPDLMLRFSDNIKVLPVSCPSQIDPFSIIKLLKNSCAGVITACPKDACCCPENKKLMKRREIVKDILPLFGFHREQFQIASVSPFGGDELMKIIEQMMSLINLKTKKQGSYKYINLDDKLAETYKWVN